MSREVGIVVPAYRPDWSRLRGYLRRLERELAPAALLVELDGPIDEDVQLDEFPGSVHAVQHRRGKGAAVTAGFERLETDVHVFADADGSTSPAALRDVIAPVVDGSVDLAVGSRRHPEATVAGHQSYLRRHLGDLFVKIARHFLPVKLYDYQCGAKAIGADLWRRVRGELTAPGFAWDIDLLTAAALRNAEIVEVPITWTDQPGSTVAPTRTSVAFGRALLRAWHRSQVAAGSRTHGWLSQRVGTPRPLIQQLDAPSDVFRADNS